MARCRKRHVRYTSDNARAIELLNEIVNLPDGKKISFIGLMDEAMRCFCRAEAKVDWDEGTFIAVEKASPPP